jgi:hypothetical protein
MGESMKLAITFMLLWLSAAVGASAQTLQDAMAGNEICYLFATQTVAREKPDLSSAIVNTFPPFAIALVRALPPGWAYIEPATIDAKTRVGGWIQPARENIVAGGVMALVGRRDDVRAKAWPQSIQLDIIRGHVRVGFTKEQVQIAHRSDGNDHGEPTSKSSEETATGVVEKWTYQNATYTLTGGRVTKINRVE